MSRLEGRGDTLHCLERGRDKIGSAIQAVHCSRVRQYSLQTTALVALNLESILLPENQANAFESASFVTGGYHLAQCEVHYTSLYLTVFSNPAISIFDVFGKFYSHASALLPVTVFPAIRPSPR